MKRLLLFMLFLFFFTTTAKAKKPFGVQYLIGGMTYSSFTSINANGIFRPFFGVGHQWEKSNSALSINILLVTRGGIVRNKTLEFPTEEPRDVYFEDIYFSITYFEIPVFLTYYFRNRLIHNFSKIHFFIGPSIYIPIRYNYHKKTKGFAFRYNHENKKTYHFDYKISQDYYSILGNINLGENLGVGVIYHSLSIAIIYSHELLPFGNVKDISNIKKKSSSLNIIFSKKLN
ncbi:MAG: hypothetical protein GXO76_03440 [Calditrichaeota bacterium]|nr:hypothetical protein [Calditrichota bacterium]